MNVSVQDLKNAIDLLGKTMGDWCSPEKAFTLYSMVIAHRPKVVVEIGVWEGGSLIPFALAAKMIGNCKVIAIDAWSPETSAAGQIPVNAAWWAKAPHEEAYQKFLGRLMQFGLASIVEVQRGPSDTALRPMCIDILHIDGNHGPQAVADVKRFAPNVPVGGYVILDDIGWDGGHVRRAGEELEHTLGFDPRYELGTGQIYQRIITE